jgi:hypothetical protein
MLRRLLRLLLVLAAAAASARTAAAQPRPLYIQFEPFTVKGALYRPDSGEAEIGVLLIHRVNNYLNHGAAWELARRGFVVLAMNSRFDNNEASIIWELIALDVKTGVEFLRKTAGVRKVILFGHSGGAATLSFYQAVAERGTTFCDSPQKLTSCGAELANLPRADGLILADASSGNPVGLLRNLNPAVVKEGDPKTLDPALDPFSVANGFNAQGRSTYTPEFRQRYYAAQSSRMNRLIADASAQARQLGTDRAIFPDDNVFLIVRADGGRLPDVDVEGVTAQPRKLLKNNGAIETTIVRSVHRPAAVDPSTNALFDGGARLLTLRSFLTANAIRSTNAMTGVDWCSTNNSTTCALGQISVPLLVSAMGAGTGIRDSERLYEAAGSRDKDFFVLEGATHNIGPCAECESRKGEYGNAVKNYFNYLRDWINKRFAR